MTQQLQDETLREDLMSNDELHKQSEELLDGFLKAIGSGNADSINVPAFEPVTDILSDISISRVRQGFSPRETGTYILSLKAALGQLLEKEYAEAPGNCTSRHLPLTNCSTA